jgi:hypothetical protein
LSHLEGAYQHVATKADLAEVRAKLESDIVGLETSIARSEVQLVRWMVGIVVASAAVASSIALFVQRLMG